MGDKQPYIPMQNDNTTELGIVKNNVTEKMKAMDKKFHWLWFQNNQVQFLDFWAPGTKNRGGLCDKKPCINPSPSNQTILFNTKMSTKAPKETCRTDKIYSKGVLDKSDGTDSQREH